MQVTGQDHLHPYVAEAVVAAKRAALDIIESGVVGEGEGYLYRVSFGGHANPGHAKTPGCVNDFLTVTIQQIS